MPLPLITGIASLALEYGPAAIRGIASMFGGSNTANKVADAVEKADALFGVSKAQKELAITRELQSLQLTPDALVELEQIKVELEKQKTRRQELDLSDKQDSHHETQETIRNGDNASDEYVRHTRPRMARQSFAAMVLYIVLFELFKAFGHGTGADVYVAMTIGAPAGAYLGLRSLDGFAPYSKSGGDKALSTVSGLIKGRK